MPLYEYQCFNCGTEQEELFTSLESSPSDLPCPACDCVALRVISAPNFYLPWAPAKFDQDPLKGTPLEGSDGVNRTQYKRKRVYG